MWEKRCEEESRRRAAAEERLRRAEKELYRMHQKKYDIERLVRREESEKREHEAHIVRSLKRDQQELSAARVRSTGGAGSTNPSAYLSLDPTVNPKDSKPAAVRTRQALSSAMDFFGV